MIITLSFATLKLSKELLQLLRRRILFFGLLVDEQHLDSKVLVNLS